MTPSGRQTPTIAVVNSNEDTTEMLRQYLQHHGFSSVVIAHVTEIKRGRTDSSASSPPTIRASSSGTSAFPMRRTGASCSSWWTAIRCAAASWW
jgi:hypothetical protein